MAQTQLQEQTFVVQESELIFYYPKIVKAVGHDESLFPFKKIEDAKNAKLGTQDAASMVVNAQWRTQGNPAFQQQLGKAARSLLSSTKERIRTIDDAQRVLVGFVQWMDTNHYKYVSQSNLNTIHEFGGMGDAKYEKLSHNLTSNATNLDRSCVIYLNKYNVFASVKSPVGNCQNVAEAFALLLFLNGFDKNTLKLCRIDGLGGQNSNAGIFFRGEANRDLKYVFPSPKGLDAPTCELTGGSHAIAQCKQLYPKDADRPFDNHWIVKCGGRYYDPLYRCSYNHPDEAFDRIERVRVVKEPITQYLSPAPSVGWWGLAEVWRVTADRALILEFKSPRIQKLLGVSQKTAYVKYKTDGVEDDVDVVVGDASEGFTLPHGLGRVFGYCLPYDNANLNTRLMKAVSAYERGCTGFFRNASPESVDFCRRARVFCKQTETAPDNGKIYRPTDGADWKKGRSWSQDEARQIVGDAIYGVSRPPLVGTTLRKCLWEAFGVPSFFRS
jgi:hypothetical protein